MNTDETQQSPQPWNVVGGRWWKRQGIAVMAVLSVTSVIAVGRLHAGNSELMGVGAAGAYTQHSTAVAQPAAETYMLNAMRQTGQYYAPPLHVQPAMDFTEPHAQQQQLEGMQPVPCSQSLAGCGSAQEMANPIEAPNYNSGAGMTYMPSTQSGVSSTDQPIATGNFLKDESKSKRHMKKLAKLLKKSAKAQDELDIKVLTHRFCPLCRLDRLQVNELLAEFYAES